MPKKKTNEEFIKEVYNLVGKEYTFLEEYKNNKIKLKIRHNCRKCNNHIYMIRPDKFLQGQRCPKCAGKDKNTEDFKRELYDLVGNEYTVLGEYINAHVKIKVKHNCNKCKSYEYEVRPNDFLQGKRCPRCIGRNKSTEEFKQEVYDLVGNEYTVLGEYKNSSTKIKIKHNCSKCKNYEYIVSPNSFLQGNKCPKCFSTPKKTTEQFKQEVYNLVGKEYEVIGNYEGNHKKISIIHNSCSKKYFVEPITFIRGSRCPFCKESKGEKTITNYLISINIDFQIQFRLNNCRNKNTLPFDFAIFNKKNELLGLIEYDGKQHFEINEYFGGKLEFEQTKLRDQIKTNYCRDNKIPLLRIKYTQFDSISTILDDFLKDPSKYIDKNYYEEVLN